MASIFTRIIEGEIPCYKVAENEKFFAFLDIRPLAAGHTLVIPKEEIDYIFDIDDVTLAEMMLYAKRIAVAMKEVIDCKRIGVAVLGLEVPHAHIHLVPMKSERDITFTNPRVSLTDDEFKRLAKAIGDKIK